MVALELGHGYRLDDFELHSRKNDVKGDFGEYQMEMRNR